VLAGPGECAQEHQGRQEHHRVRGDRETGPGLWHL